MSAPLPFKSRITARIHRNAAICLLTAIAAFGADSVNVPGSGGTGYLFTPSGYIGFQTFRIDAYKWHGADYGYQLFNNAVYNFTATLGFSPHFSAHAGIEGYAAFNTTPRGEINTSNEAALSAQWTFYIGHGEMTYKLDHGSIFGISEKKFRGEIGFGLFPYKYNPDARNLGEYMFRTGTYPGWIKTTFDVPWTRLTGLRVSTTSFDKWHNDLLLTTEMEMAPLFDLSLTWMSDITLGNFGSIGAGVSLCRLIAANDQYTTPRDKPDNIAWLTKNSSNGFDTNYYTFKGIKPMVRACFDPKGVFKHLGWNNAVRLFGEDELKIYGEAAILGVANQGASTPRGLITAYYDTLEQRIPVMGGFNLPTFKLIDVVSFELEYYGSPYPNDYGRQVRFRQESDGLPLPTTGMGNVYNTSTGIYRNDNYKWSVYFKRSFGPHFFIVGQAARDHWRTATTYDAINIDTEEALTTKKHWYWALKTVAVF